MVFSSEYSDRKCIRNSFDKGLKPNMSVCKYHTMQMDDRIETQINMIYIINGIIYYWINHVLSLHYPTDAYFFA